MAVTCLAVTVLVAVCIKDHRENLGQYLARKGKKESNNEEGIELMTQNGEYNSDDEAANCGDDEDLYENQHKTANEGDLVKREALPIYV